MRVLLIVIFIATISSGLGATLQSGIDMRKFARDGLTPPRSVIPLALNLVERDLLEQRCSYAPLMIVPIPKGKHRKSANYSRTLELEKEPNGVNIFECAKGISCSPISRIPMQNTLRFEGSEFIYSIEGDLSKLSGVVGRKPVCSSAHLRVIENTAGTLALPRSLWVLGYDTHIALWDPVHERTWFEVQLPTGQTMEQIRSVQVNSDLRILIEGVGGSFILLDWTDNFALFRKPNSAVWATEGGLGNAAHADEWSQTVKNQQLALLASELIQPLGTLGVSLNTIFIPWANLNPSRLEAPPPLALPARIIAANQLDSSDTSSQVVMAVRNDSGIKLFVWNAASGSIEPYGVELRNDNRASDEHYMIGGSTLYRLTSDGFYEVKSSTETPKALPALKEKVYGYGSAFLTTNRQGHKCSMNLWILPQHRYNSFAAPIANKPCYSGAVIGLYPGGASLSGWSGSVYQINMVSSE